MLAGGPYTSRMTDVFADCPTHGIVLISNLVNVRPGGDVKLRGSTTCPVCGASSAFIDGHYRTGPNGDESVTLSPSLAQLLRLQTALAWAQKALRDTETDPTLVERKLRKTVEKEAPALVTMIDAALGTRSATVAAWIAILVSVLTLVMGGHEKGISPADVARIVDQVQRDEETSGTPPTIDPTMTRQPMPKGQTASLEPK